MHEFSTAVGIVDTVTGVATQHNASRIKKIELVVGDFSMLQHDQLRFAFEIAGEGTLAEGAELVIEGQKGEIECQDCKYKGVIGKSNKEVDHLVVDLINIFECPNCHSNRTKISGGRDIYVKNIEIELSSE
ncbi:MAG: hydrogenase maturation nickel metallochaperone HypA [Candidatus Heimdallarchaeota archaeon]|nr:hydrogenase maturation nickel metallochaperone HypA [Candidatus Heimdallarchaeota archaeon]